MADGQPGQIGLTVIQPNLCFRRCDLPDLDSSPGDPGQKF
jgi:hypothetical protein